MFRWMSRLKGSRSPTFWVMMRSPGLERRVCTCGQRIWRRAMSLRSRGALLATAAQTHSAPAAAAAAGRDSVKGENQWFVVRPQFEWAALEPRAEMFNT